MIRAMTTADLPSVLQIWLSASIKAHYFIPESFWHGQLDAMRDQYLPQAQTLVAEDSGAVQGFAALLGDTLAALFVAPDAQGKGIGQALLTAAMRDRDRLELSVYCANQQAQRFYAAAGFTALTQRDDPHTGQPELLMCWRRTPLRTA